MDRNQKLLFTSVGAITALALEKLVNLLFFRKQNTHHTTDILRTHPPHPAWTPPQPQPPPYDPALGYHSVDPSSTPSDVLYPLVISSVVPRPIAFISTLGEDGTQNLAPYSYFNVVGHSPPLVVIGFCSTKLRDHGKKDSLYNISATKEFVVNIISEWFVEAANHCCGNFPYGTNEMALSGLTPLPSQKIAPPRIAESAVQLECIVRHTYDAPGPGGQGGSTVVLGEVVMWHVAEGVAGKSPSGKLVVDIQKLKPISRLGGNTYGRTNDIFDLPRPDR